MGKRGWAAIVLIPLLGCLCHYGFLLWPGTTLAGMDFLNLDYPRAELIHRAFIAGRIPLWNPYEWGGCPLLAAMQGSVLYPPIWPMLLLPQPYGLQVSIFVHVVWAAVGAALLARYLLQCPSQVAAFSGIAYACSGYYVGRIEQANIVATFSWTPWIFLTATRLMDGRGSWQAMLGAISLCILPGHPQTTALALLGCAVFITSRAVFNRSASRYAAALRLALLSVMGALGVTAAQLLPTQELSALSERVWSWPDPMSPALKWEHLPALVVPGYFRHLAHVSWGKAFGYTELGLYCGVLAFPLAVWGAVVSVRNRDATGCALLATWIFSMLFALGNSGLIANPFVKFIPLFTHSRGVGRMLNSSTLCYTLLAAHGLYAAVRFLATRKGLKRHGLVYATCIALLIADLCWTNWTELYGQLVDSTAVRRISPLASHLKDGARLYRFMQNDSDLYLDNRASLVPYRGARLLPNLTSVQRVQVLDGYEEALLPTRAWANLLRRYNRNLRSDHVDARLVALLGAGHLLTDYPIRSFGLEWKSVAAHQWPAGGISLWGNLFSPVAALEDVLTSDGVSVATRIRETFNEETTTGLAAEFVNREGYAFALPGRKAVSHAFSTMSRQEFTSLSCAAAGQLRFNEISFRLERPVSHNLVLLGPSFAGSNVYIEHSGMQNRLPLLRHTCASSLLPLTGALPAQTLIQLRYEPYSFRLGLFISLVMLCGLLFSGRRKLALTG
ncbi:MAG: hypothetical protein ACR2IE_19545 [Candidatus Sumerlaeaceae bacterium]